MSSALSAGLSGLEANQQMLDVIGNNLANVNTTGYKSQSVSFSSMLGDSMSLGSAPTATAGGTNAVQIGGGVQVAGIETNETEGTLQSTGRNLDLAIQGQGFFTVNNGTANLYTRSGSFALDASNNLVDPGTGYIVQSVGGTGIKIDPNAVQPAKATDTVTLAGNLSTSANPPAAEVLGSLTPLTQGTPAAVVGSGTGPFALADGDTLTIAANGGAAQTVTFGAAEFASIGAATAAEVAAAISSQVSGVSATVSAAGAVTLQSTATGLQSTLEVTDGTGSPASALGLSTSLTAGTETPATAATLLNDLPETSKDYVAGDKIVVTGNDANGQPVSATFVYGSGAGQNGTTVGALTTFLGTAFPASSVALGADGTLSFTANATGLSSGTVTLSDATGDTGATSFSSLPFVVKTPGTSGDTATAGISVFDAQGGSHDVTLTFTKTAANTWNMTATLPSNDGTVVSGSVQGITFNADGSFSRVSGGAANLSFSFAGSTAPQTISLGFGTAGKDDGLTQLGGSTAAIAGTQDGYAAGSLSSLSVGADGTISGLYSNGQTKSLAQLQVATFTNPGGLLAVGNSFFGVSANSGAAVVGQSGGGSAGSIESGVLEGSNVDLSTELTRLITAQSAFQANSKTITTADQMLQDLTNLIH
jgi:flagellar hook protein FlgE